MMKRIFTCFCALVLLVSCFSGMFVQAAELEAVQPAIEATVPETTEAEETVPEETTPAETVPEETVPAEAEAVETAPAAQPEEEEEVASEIIECSTVISNAFIPATYAAAQEHELGQSFISHVQKYIAKCEQFIPVDKFKVRSSAGGDLISLIYYESPELFSPCSMRYYTSGGYVTKLEVLAYQPYSDTPAEYSACLEAIREARDILVKGVKGNTSLNDVEKALILHDRLAMWNEYDLGIYKYNNYNKPEIYSAVGPLMNQSGVCQGISLAYMYMLEEVGIESDLCSSQALNHAWNIVYIDDIGYHVDVTWDDATNATNEEFHDDYGRVYHNNFLLSSNGIWNTGHKAYDYNTSPTDTRYDNSGWWRNTETSIQLVSTNLLYYRSKNDGHIYRAINGSGSIVKYTDGYKGKLSGLGTDLFYNNKKTVYKLDMTNGNVTTVWSPASIAGGSGYIEGLKYEKCKLYVQLNNGSGYSWREYIPYYDPDFAVKITTQPTNTVTPDGQTAKVTVKAQGDGLTYAWYIKKAGYSSFVQVGAAGATYSAKMNVAMDGCQVYCIVTDEYGFTAQSNTVTMIMGNPATITTQPKSVKVYAGNTVKISVAATGDGLRYIWFYLKKGETDYTMSTSHDTKVFSVKMSSEWDGAKVYCMVMDQYNTAVKSSVVTITESKGVTITTQPTNAVAKNKKTAKVTVKATGEGLKYTWYYAKKGSSKFTKTNVTSASYSVKMSSSVNGRKVYCVITDKYGNTAKTKTVTLYKGNPLTIKTQPANAKAPAGIAASTKVTASGDGLKYVWYHRSAGATKWSKSSVTKSTYSVKMSASVKGRQAYCVITDKYGISVKTGTVTFGLAASLKITKQPVSTEAKKDTTVKLTAAATGEGVTYTWYYAKKGSSKFKKVSGNKSTYSVKMTSSVNGRKVYCLIKDKYGVSIKTKTVTLTVFDPVKTVTGTWKGYRQVYSDGWWDSVSGMSIKITSKSKVTVKVKYAGDGYNKGTFNYKLRYVKKTANTWYYQFYNSTETLDVTYVPASKQLRIHFGNYMYLAFKK